MSQHNVNNIIKVKSLKFDDPLLPSVIYNAIGNPTPDKINKVIKSYEYPNHKIIGAYVDNILIGIIGINQANMLITIRHLSILQNFRKQGIGTLLLDDLKKRFTNHKIVLETDKESVGFYIKSHFVCCKFKSEHKRFRYVCEFMQH